MRDFAEMSPEEIDRAIEEYEKDKQERMKKNLEEMRENARKQRKVTKIGLICAITQLILNIAYVIYLFLILSPT